MCPYSGETFYVFLEFFWRTKSTDTPVFGLMVKFALGFKARVDPLLDFFFACMQWIP